MTMTTTKLHVRKGDTVVVLWGKDKGKKGKVLTAFPKDGKVLVEGVHMVKRHTKPSQKVRQTGIMEKPIPVFVSKVMLVCPKCSKATRAAKMQLDGGKRSRKCKRCGELIDKT